MYQKYSDVSCDARNYHKYVPKMFNITLAQLSLHTEGKCILRGRNNA